MRSITYKVEHWNSLPSPNSDSALGQDRHTNLVKSPLFVDDFLLGEEERNSNGAQNRV